MGARKIAGIDPPATTPIATAPTMVRPHRSARACYRAHSVTRALALSIVLVAGSAPAATLFPALNDPDFRFDPAIAVFAGGLKTEQSPTDAYGGVELSFDSGVFQPGKNRLRTHLAFGRFAGNGLKLSTIEFSPRYTLPIGSGFSIDFGPGFAYQRSTAGDRSSGQTAWLLAAGLGYRDGAYRAGVDLRYLDTREETVGTVVRDPDNWALTAKLGFHF